MAAEPAPLPHHDQDDTRRVIGIRSEPQPLPAVHRVDDREEQGVSVEIPKAYNLERDRIRWGPVLAGLFTALTTSLLLGLLGLAWTLTVANTNAPSVGAVLPAGTGTGAAIWGAVSGIVSFFLGGYVAGWSAAAFGQRWGALNGALVFLVAIPFLLWLTGSSLGVALGNLGALAGVVNTLPPAQAVGPTEFGRAAEGLRDATWWTLLGMLLALGAAAAGGAIGTRRRATVPLDPDVDVVRR